MNLAESMIRNSKDHEFHFFINNKYPDEIAELVSKLCDLVPRSQIHVFSIPSPTAEADTCSQANAAELLREAYIAKVNPDVLLITSLFEGCYEEIAVSIKKLIKDLPTAVIFYDLIPFVEKDKYLTTEATHKHYFRKIDYLKKADLLLSISEFTRSEGMRLLKSDCPNVINISSAPDSKFCSGVTPASEEKRIKEKYGIYCPYVMYVSSFDQRKNQEGLIRAFAKAQQSINQDLQLILVGNGWDEIYKKLKILANNLGIPDKKLIFTGKVTDSDLLVLYRMCHLFVFPSFSEGFGIPVVEAMSCGIPTIASHSTSLIEIIEEKEAMFNPHDDEEMARLIKKGIVDQKFRGRLINNSKKRAPLFSWDITGRKALMALEASFKKKQNCAEICLPELSELLNQIAQGCNRVSDEILVDISNSLEPLYSTRKNVGWITTWNSRCGIAKYSEFQIDAKHKSLFIMAPRDESTFKRDSENVLRCWRLGFDELDNLYTQIINKEIFYVVIQFKCGFFEMQKLSNLINKLVLLGREVFITLHSIPFPKAKDKDQALFMNTLNLCNKIFIRTDFAKNIEEETVYCIRKINWEACERNNSLTNVKNLESHEHQLEDNIKNSLLLKKAGFSGKFKIKAFADLGALTLQSGGRAEPDNVLVLEELQRYRKRLACQPLLEFNNPTAQSSRIGSWEGLEYPDYEGKHYQRVASCFCTRAQLESSAFRYWVKLLGLKFQLHRKVWEFAFILQALYERGALRSGNKGLGFAVGEEPLPAFFASIGCEVVATDLDPGDERAKVWADTAQLATSLDKLRRPNICPDKTFSRQVSFRHEDMNQISYDLRNFDFTWSSCSFEHCGSLQQGMDFIINQMACLKPGGVAVHTTEFNLSSNDQTVSDGTTVIFRRKDIEQLVASLKSCGHDVEAVDYSIGNTDEDRAVDVMPYTAVPHLKLLLFDKYISTSIALIIKKSSRKP
jgi:glycosyltransferase involved in cell wall biosynthesis